MSLWHKGAPVIAQDPPARVERGRSDPDRATRSGPVELGNDRDVRHRLRALAALDRAAITDAVVLLPFRLLDSAAADVTDLDARDKTITSELASLVTTRKSTLAELCGLSTKSAAELLVETGDPRRFTEGGYARFNGTAPIPASSGEGDGEPVRHRLDQGGNRQINAVLHRMAITQLRCNPAARDLYERARKRGHTKREAMRILKRHLSNAIYRTMLRDTLRTEKSDQTQEAA